MGKQINVLEIIRIGMILFIITAISAVLLAFVNLKTAPKIAENEIQKTQEAMKVLLPEAASFEKLEPSDNPAVTERYLALDEAGNTAGTCVIASVNGYGGEIQVLTGVNAEGNVTGVDILSHSETPGLGANAVKEDFKGQFTGKSGELSVVKTNAGEHEINAMSGATITSRAVTEAVNTGISESARILEDKGGEQA